MMDYETKPTRAFAERPENHMTDGARRFRLEVCGGHRRRSTDTRTPKRRNAAFLRMMHVPQDRRCHTVYKAFTFF